MFDPFELPKGLTSHRLRTAVPEEAILGITWLWDISSEKSPHLVLFFFLFVWLVGWFHSGIEMAFFNSILCMSRGFTHYQLYGTGMSMSYGKFRLACLTLTLWVSPQLCFPFWSEDSISCHCHLNPCLWRQNTAGHIL